MARRRRPLVPEAREELDQLKVEVMKKKGYQIEDPDQTKFEVAKGLGIPLKEKGNQDLSSHDAGRIGGQIGGTMVHELIQRAKDQLNKQ
ncbi:alpha/beta-type small acid-soluble spore protein [Bacillus sp. Marseille-Q3570]|uniref:alpha/beta-type small acid-soluble spore protein n=1 Tax=Bacillus sp. Marseille-Q3570 TaxID=2963522 RepID=UPI0021B7BB8A|nr:alpha/beta-type small acid-soluble spore protein [Bacillus sp. Marseille-Q3570]